MVTETDPASPVNADMWRAIGRLEGATGALLEGQREIKAGLEETQREFRSALEETRRELRTGLEENQREFRSALNTTNQRIETLNDSVNQRIDRLFYAMIAVGGALAATVLASRFIGG